jgi:hypothetical protein
MQKSKFISFELLELEMAVLGCFLNEKATVLKELS